MVKSWQVSAHDKNLVNMQDTQSSPSVGGGGAVDEHTEMEREQQEENLPDSLRHKACDNVGIIIQFLLSKSVYLHLTINSMHFAKLFQMIR